MPASHHQYFGINTLIFAPLRQAAGYLFAGQELFGPTLSGATNQWKRHQANTATHP